MTTFRCDTSWSSLFAIQEDVFLKIASDKDPGSTRAMYKMVKKEKELLDTFMYALNTGLLCNKGSIDANGKSTLYDPDTNRPINLLRIAA